MLRIITYLCCILICTQCIVAQGDNLDSLKLVVEEMPEDSAKCATLNAISRLLYSGEESRQYARRALGIAKRLNDSLMIGLSYYRLAWSHDYGMMEIKKRYLDSAIVVYSNLGDLSGLAMTYNLKAIMFMDYGSFDNSEEYWQRAHDIYAQLGDRDKQATIYNNWGVCLYMAEKPLEAIEKYKMALEYRLTEQPEAPLKISRVYNGFAESYRLLEDYTTAADYHVKAYLRRKKTGNIAVSETLINMAGMFFEAVQVGGDTLGLMDGFRNLGFSNAMSLLDSASLIQGISDRLGLKYTILDARRKGHIANGDYKSAYDILTTQKKIDEEEKLSESSLGAYADLNILYEQEQLKTQLLQEEVINQKKGNQVNLLLLFLSIASGALIIGYQIYQNRMKKNQLQLAEAMQEQRIVSMRSMLEGQEKERARIARDLHDGLGNLLATLKGSISSMRIDFSGSGDKHIYTKASDMIDEACSEVRKIAHEMMPQALSKLGLRMALDDLMTKMEHTHEFNTQFTVYGNEVILEENTNVMLFRIVQELLNNIVKYAKAREVLLQLTYSDEWLNLTVEDDGIGFNSDDVTQNEGMGLKSIAFRTNYVGGNYEIDSRPGMGTLVSINVPL